MARLGNVPICELRYQHPKLSSIHRCVLVRPELLCAVRSSPAGQVLEGFCTLGFILGFLYSIECWGLSPFPIAWPV